MTKAVLTETDLNLIKQLIDVSLDEKLDEKLEEKLNEKLGAYPTKEEFFASMDKIMSELKAIREEQTVQAHQLSNHEDRITTLETHLQ